MPAEALPHVWRLILSKPANGAWNMAVDEAILDAVGRRTVPPTLRLFAWEPPCISIGFAQSTGDVDFERLVSLGWDIVRRPTGGKAILHTDELTYSIIGPHDEPIFKGSLLESYRIIASGLLEALEELGVNAFIEPGILATPPGIEEQEAICFENPSKYEITVDHKKLLGSAQARRKEGILQHGTLPLFGDIARITQVLAYPGEADRLAAGERMRKRATTVEEALGHPITWETAAQAFVSGFEKRLGLRFARSNLTPEEEHRSSDLLREKYTSQQWTIK